MDIYLIKTMENHYIYEANLFGEAFMSTRPPSSPVCTLGVTPPPHHHARPDHASLHYFPCALCFLGSIALLSFLKPSFFLTAVLFGAAAPTPSHTKKNMEYYQEATDE